MCARIYQVKSTLEAKSSDASRHQSDAGEVCGGAAAATSAIQELAAGATLRRTLEISGGRHPGATHRTKRREFTPSACVCSCT